MQEIDPTKPLNKLNRDSFTARFVKEKEVSGNLNGFVLNPNIQLVPLNNQGALSAKDRNMQLVS